MKKWIEVTTIRLAGAGIGALGAGLVLLAPPAAAQVSWVGNTAVDAAWATGGNWSSSLVPAVTDDVVINAGSSALNPVVISTTGQTAKTLKLGVASGDFGALLMTDGDFYTPGEFRIGDAGEGRLTVTNGILATTGAISLGFSGSGNGLLVLSGGTISCTNKMYVGNSGTGTVVVAGGSFSSSGNNNDPTLGYNLGSLGSLVVSNGTFKSSYAIVVGSSGSGHLIQNGGDISMSRQLYVGSQASGSGVVDLSGGTFKVSYDCYIGGSGHGELNITPDATVTVSRCMKIGFAAGSSGIVRTGNVTILAGTDHYPYVVGAAGHGEIHPKGTTFMTNRKGLEVRTSTTGFGLVNGWGGWTSAATANYKIGVNVNNGLVVANGFGEDCDLDFSAYVASVNTSSTTNSIENTTTNGWYAIDQGRLVLGGIDLGVGSAVGVSWGEALGDTEIDLVNSARFEFGNITTAGRLVGKLLASDRTDVPALPASLTCIGVWDFSFTGAFDTADLQLRYDAVAAQGKFFRIMRWNTGNTVWEPIPTNELSNFRLEAEGLTSLGLFAVFATEPPTLIIVK